MEASLVTGEAAGHTAARFKGCVWEEVVGGMVLIVGGWGGAGEARLQAEPWWGFHVFHIIFIVL